MSRRLELLFNEPILKIDDVILSVGDDEEMMELVRRLQEDRSEGMRDEPGTELFRD